jgi:hypothetical protein
MSDVLDFEVLEPETDLGSVLRAIGALDHVELREYVEEAEDRVVTYILFVAREYRTKVAN